MSERQADPALEERPRICQAQGCEVDVNSCGRYCRKRRLCPEHLKATSLCRKKYGDEQWRFCQQCGKLELLVKFDGMKRSCRDQLARRRIRVSSTKGERRRSHGAEPSRSIDRTSSEGSERLSEDGGAASGPHADPAAAAAAAPVPAPAPVPAAADSAVEAAAAAARGAAAAGIDALEGQSSGDAAVALAAALGGTQPCQMGYQGIDAGLLPYGMDLATYQQYGIELQSVLTGQQQQQQQQQQAEESLLQHGPTARQLLVTQQQQQGMLGLQQQQAQLMLAQHAADHSVAPGAVLAPADSDSESAGQLQSLLSAAAHAGNRSASSELLFQLIREQQMLTQLVQDPEWQQPVVSLPMQGEPPPADAIPTGHAAAADVEYSFSGGPLDSAHAQQTSAQQQQQQQQQQSMLQQMLLDHHRHQQQQQQLGVLQQCLMQQPPSLVYRSRSAGGVTSPHPPPAGYTCFMGMASAASEPAMNTAMDAAMNAALASDTSGGLLRMQLPARGNAAGSPTAWMASKQASYAAAQAVNSMPMLQAAASDTAAGASLDQSFPVQQQQPGTFQTLLLPDQQAQQRQARQQQQQQQQQLLPQQQGVTSTGDFEASANWGQNQDPDPTDFSLDDLDDFLVAAGAAEGPTDPVVQLRSLSAAQQASQSGGLPQSQQQDRQQEQQQEQQQVLLQDGQCLLRTADSAPA